MNDDANVEYTRRRTASSSAPHHFAVPTYALDATVADEVVDVNVLAVVVRAVAADRKPLLPGGGAADLELLLMGDGPATLADSAKRFGRTHGLCILFPPRNGDQVMCLCEITSRSMAVVVVSDVCCCVPRVASLQGTPKLKSSVMALIEMPKDISLWLQLGKDEKIMISVHFAASRCCLVW